MNVMKISREKDVESKGSYVISAFNRAEEEKTTHALAMEITDLLVKASIPLTGAFDVLDYVRFLFTNSYLTDSRSIWEDVEDTVPKDLLRKR